MRTIVFDDKEQEKLNLLINFPYYCSDIFHRVGRIGFGGGKSNIAIFHCYNEFHHQVICYFIFIFFISDDIKPNVTERWRTKLIQEKDGFCTYKDKLVLLTGFHPTLPQDIELISHLINMNDRDVKKEGAGTWREFYRIRNLYRMMELNKKTVDNWL